ncbi:MAG TPA: glycosyltransferase family 39 protein [Thermoanaerobaculia bacterium]
MNERRVWSLLLLVAAIAVGAYLRFDGLGQPSYWLDEILHQHLTTAAAAKPWWQWFGRLEEEHAGLYYFTQLATRIFGTSEFAGRSAAALFGLATIPLVWLGVRQPQLPPSSAIAAILLATSPLHVYFSREARGYALIAFLTAALIVILLRGRSLIAACIVLLALLYTSAVAAPVIASAAAVCFLIAILSRERWYAIAGTCAMATLALIRVIYISRPMTELGLPGAPKMDAQFFTSLARSFSVTALGTAIGQRTAFAMLAFALIGVVALARRDRRAAIVLTGMTVLPLAITLAAVRVFDHFFGARYVIASLVGYVMLAAIGIAFVAQLTRRAAPIVAITIAIVIAAQGWSSARTEPFQKLDWRGIAAALRRHVQPGDVILAAEPWSDVSLRYYLGDIPNVKLVYMAGVGIAQIMVDETAAQAHDTWLVTAGASTDTAVRTWMCRYPVVMASALESFRLHHAHEDIAFGDGWANPEGTFRWAVGKRATLNLSIRDRRDHTISFRAYPAAPQTMRVSLNGHAVASIALANEWRDYAITAPTALWNKGLNTLAFDFEKAVVPSAHDQRPLAVSFQRITLDGATETKRIATDTFIDANTAWRNSTTRFPASTLRRDRIEPLLVRLGIDPNAGWSQLTRGNVQLENLAATIAYGSDCVDDRAFVHRAFAILLEHAPDATAERDLLRRLRNGESRERVITRIVKSDEFRARVSAAARATAPDRS